MRDRLKNYKDYDDFLKQYENHREKHDARSTLYREEGWKELNEKYDKDYKNEFEEMDDMNSEMNKNYNQYRFRFYERYWDTRDNHAYYALPASTRAWLTFKKVSEFWLDL